ncbi:MAG: DUF4834 family protein, partial [Clostridiales bacterium]|nr:DUF4834 family protein [Clostridiales bacterium]
MAEEAAYAGEDVQGADITEEFDVTSGMYVQTLARGLEFISSVPNGAVVSDGVYFEIPSNINTQFQKDGEYIDFHNKTAISSQGYYILRLYGLNTYGEQTAGVFTFRIGSAPSNKADTGEYKYPKITTAATVAYDEGTGLYKYTLPNYKAFYSSVSDYGESVESASFIIPRNMGYSLTRNGGAVTYIKNKVYTEAGSYKLKIYGLSYASGGGYEACYETTLDFTINDLSAESYAAESADITAAIIAYNTEDSSSAAGYSSETSAESNIVSDTLRESYFETANIYSESFSTGDSFYTNIPNDGIVGGNVYFDIPYNMSVSVSKDGTPVEFNNKTYINDPGSYVMTVTDVFEGVTSRAKFSFRIQSGVETPEGVAEETVGDSVDGEGAVDEESGLSYSVTNEYDITRKMYVFTLGGESLYMSVPNGMISNDEVKFDIPDNIEKSLIRDDEEVELFDGVSVSEDGRYALNLKTGSEEEGNFEELTLEFDIASEPVNYLDEFTMPEGYSLIKAEYSDYGDFYSEIDDVFIKGLSEIDLQNESYESVFSLPLDGEYDFILQGGRGMPILSFTLFIDRTAPVITFEGLDENMSAKEESVMIYCSESDAEVILIDSSGNESSLDMSGGGGKISGKGSYTLIARDKTGNENVYNFVLGGSGGLSGIAGIIYLIVFLIIFVALIVVIVIIVRKIFGFGGKKDKKEKKEKKEKTDKKEKKEKKTKKDKNNKE